MTPHLSPAVDGENCYGADKAIAVNPSAKLARACAACGWPVMKFK